MAKKLKIFVIGAGMGGVTIAIILQRAGHDVRVFERASRPAKVGAGINVGPNSARIFRQLGLEDSMRSIGIEPRFKLSRDWRSGEVTFKVPVPELTKRYNARFFAFHRGLLQDTLADALDSGTINFDKALVSLNPEGDAVHCGFADGSFASADLVIGADGVHSKTRELLFGVAPADYYGLVSYRSLIPTSSLGGLIPDDNVKWWAPHGYVLHYYTTEARDEINLVTGSPEAWTASSYAPQPATVEQLLITFEGFHPEVQTILRAAQSISKWPMLERQPFRPWSQGPVVLIGDACHPTTPHLGQGAGMAFEDAVVLARCIDQFADADLSSALAAYERMRFERTSRIQKESHANEWTKTGMDGDWLYSYDAFAVSLDTAP